MKTTNFLDVGARIKELRLAKGWSQNDLALKVGVQRPSVSQWESGDTQNIKNSYLIGLSNAFDITVDELLTGIPPLQVNEPSPAYKTSPLNKETIKNTISLIRFLENKLDASFDLDEWTELFGHFYAEYNSGQKRGVKVDKADLVFDFHSIISNIKNTKSKTIKEK